jgi:hypothetical protein
MCMKEFEYKPLNIDSSQEEKLIEMAEKLFPEYNSFWIERFDADNKFVIMTNMEKDIFRGSEISIGGHKYHWFELSMFICNRMRSEFSMPDLFGAWGTRQAASIPFYNVVDKEKVEAQPKFDHIVDYIYDQFAKHLDNKPVLDAIKEFKKKDK